MSRLLCVLGVALPLCLARPALGDTSDEPYQVSLTTIPSRVFKDADGTSGKSHSEGWVFHVLVNDRRKRELIATAAVAELYAADKLVKTIQFTEGALSKLRGVTFRAGPRDPEISAKRFASQEELFDLRHQFIEPAAFEIGRVVYRLELRTPQGQRITSSLVIPVARYSAKTKLIFPIKGEFTVVNGHVTEGGHTERSQQFAYDIVGLGPHLEMLIKGEGTVNEEFLCWGREVVAPANGVVSYARNDVPNQITPGSVDRKLIQNLPEPIWAAGGNCVVLDHGNGEWSYLGHLQPGSVRVRKGDHVRQGQLLGRLGSSGNAQGPHLHYHLMAGPVIYRSDGLPSQFVNVPDSVPRQGRYSEAK